MHVEHIDPETHTRRVLETDDPKLLPHMRVSQRKIEAAEAKRKRKREQHKRDQEKQNKKKP